MATAAGKRWVRGLGVVAGLLSAPAFAQSEALLDAVRLHADGARKKAEAELAACVRASCAERPRLALLTGVLQLAEGDAEVAAKTLGSAGAPKALEPWHHYYLGQAEFYRRRYDAAAQHFEQALKDAPPALRARAVARLGEAHLSAGNAAAALPHLDEAAAKEATAELVHARATARAALGNHNGARADWILLAVRHPDHPYGEAAALKLSAGRSKYRFTFEERLSRHGAFSRAGLAQAALGELDAIDKEKLARGGTARARLSYARAVALVSLGREEEALPHLDAVMKGPRSLAAQAAMLKARRALKKGDRTLARKLMGEVAKKYPKEAPADEALYLAGWLDLQEGRFEAAVATFEDFEKTFRRSRKVDEAIWFKSLALLRLEKHSQAQASFTELTKRFPRSSLVPQARYWATRAAQLGGAKAEEIAPTYEQLISQYPGSFYALLSRLRLNELGKTPAPAFPEAPSALDEKMPPELSRALALTRAGLFRDASEEVGYQLSRVRGSDAALKWGHALAQLGDYGAAYQLAARHLWGAAYGKKKGEAVALLYPRAYRQAVEKAAREQKIPVWLVWAIMRRESAFRAEVSSPADARGLMQIIPPTARAIARKLGDEVPPPDALYAPDVNIRYGAWYLAQLAERFTHPALVAAAYNAGPPAVVKWVTAEKDLPLDLFVEFIPYRETRGYVKQVVADYHLYQALYADPAVIEPVALKLPQPKTEGVNF